MSDYAVYEGKLVPVDELMHHGVKGMKWGVRRYQNPDGSLTEAGRKRYYGYGTLDTEGKAAYKSYKKINGELVGQATRRASVVGGLAGGAIGLATGGPAGAFAGLMGSMVLSTVATATINTGAAWVSNKKYKKALIKQADEKRHAQEIRDNAQKKDNEFYKKVIDSEEKRAGRQLTDKEKADAIKSYSKEGRGEEAAKKYLEQEKSVVNKKITDAPEVKKIKTKYSEKFNEIANRTHEEADNETKADSKVLKNMQDEISATVDKLVSETPELKSYNTKEKKQELEWLITNEIRKTK